MNLSESIIMALINLKNSKFRSFLSMLGIMIGIAAVIIVVAIINGTKEEVLKNIGPADSFIYSVFPQLNQQTMTLTEIKTEDLEIFQSLPFVKSVLPKVSQSFSIRTGKKTLEGEITLMDPDYLSAHRLTLIAGRNINAFDVQERSRVCLISKKLSKSLFYSASPVGESIFCGPSAFTVAGIVESGGESIETAWTGEEGGERIDQNDFLVPYTTTLRLEPDIRISQLNIYVSKSYTGSVVAEMKSALNFHLKKPENYIIQDPKEILAAIEKESRVFTIFLGCIASISLLVGGIGIMNVMLTSVAERTREIGVRKAVGASQKAILVQFMIESCVICVIGGSIGIILGSVISYLLPFLSSHKIASSILGSSLIVSFFFAFLVGLIFGTLPAVRASRLSPAEALRFE